MFGEIPLPTAGQDLTVQGGHASSYEYNVARALDKLGFGYVFQYDIQGGRRLRGGLVVDFLVFTMPLSTPIMVNGDYWHRDESKEFYARATIDNALRGEANPVITLWGFETETYEAALSTLRKHLR